MLLMYLSMLQTDEERAFFTKLYTKYRYQMFRVAKKYLHNEFDAEDIVHDIFKIVADDHLRDLENRTDADVRRFLLCCAKNRSLNLMKSRSKIVSLDALMEQGWDEIDLNKDPIDEIIADQALTKQAEEAISGLDPMYGEPLWLHLKGFSTADVSKLFNENYETVKKRTYRAKLLLRKAVLGEGGEA